MLRCLALLSPAVIGVWSHGFMTLPTGRQPGAPGLDLAYSHNAKSWYSDTPPLSVEPTVCDRGLLTTGMAVESKKVPCGSRDSTATKPWRAPGSVAIHSPCGNLVGQDGSTLPPTDRTQWQAGTAVEVAAAITANHGGGWSFRLCPASSALTEACFQAHHLAFADDISTVHFRNGSTLEIQARRTTSTPGARMWSRNPIPLREDYFPAPFGGGVGSQWNFSIVDRVLIPADLNPGDYALSWRWDCEGTFQVWANCADVTIVKGPVSFSV